MATFTVVVQQLDATAGISPAHGRSVGAGTQPSGMLLSDFLQVSGGAYSLDFPVDDRTRQHWADIASITGSQELRDASQMRTIPVSVEHLRGSDPATTRVSIGFEYNLTREEGRAVERAAASGLIDL